MRESICVVGAAAARAALGVRADDPAVFRPFRPVESIRAARIIARDPAIPSAVRALATVGICCDLAPGHLSPSVARISRATGLTIRSTRARRLAWESTDPVMRFDVCARAVALILAWRADR